MSIGERLKALLDEKKISQSDLARMIEVSPMTVSKWVNEKNIPETSSLEKISKALGVSLSFLVDPKKFNASVKSLSSFSEADIKQSTIDIAMLADAQTKPRPFDAIIVWELSRFSRRQEDSIAYKSLLTKAGIKLLSATERFDPDSDEGFLFGGILEVFSELEARKIGKRSRSGKETNTKRGFWSGGVAPFGYKLVRIDDAETGKTRTTLAPDDNEAKIVRFIFRLYNEGKSIRNIAKEPVKDEQHQPINLSVLREQIIPKLQSLPGDKFKALIKAMSGRILVTREKITLQLGKVGMASSMNVATTMFYFSLMTSKPASEKENANTIEHISNALL